MIQKLTTLLFILCLTLSVQAQKKPGFSKEEFRAKQEAYLTQKAELTAEEKAAAYADYSVDSACSCLSDSGRDTAVSAGKFCCDIS